MKAEEIPWPIRQALAEIGIRPEEVAEYRWEEPTTASVLLNPVRQLVEVTYAVVPPAPKLWPRWWCWLLGHEPCESHDLPLALYRCRCGANVVTKEWMRRSGLPRLWTGLVRSLPKG